MIPNIVQTKFDKIEKDRIALMQELSTYTNEQLNQQPKNNGWSPMQTIQHLVETERDILKYMQKKSSGNATLYKTGWKQNFWFLVFQIAFRSPLKFKAPKGVTETFPAFIDFQETMETWKNNRQLLYVFLENLDDKFWDKKMFRHPAMGRIAIPHTMGFFEEHIRRHTKQIRRAL